MCWIARCACILMLILLFVVPSVGAQGVGGIDTFRQPEGMEILREIKEEKERARQPLEKQHKPVVTFEHTSPVAQQEAVNQVDYLSAMAVREFSFSEAQKLSLEAIQENPAAKDVRISLELAETIQDAFAFSLLLPNKESELIVSFDNPSIRRRNDQNYSLHFKSGASGSEAHLVVLGMDVVGTIIHGGAVYKIHPLGNGLTAVYEQDIRQLQDHPDTYNELIEKQQEEDAGPGKLESEVTPLDASAVIDVLVAYTTKAGEAVASIDALIQLMFDETETIYANSLIQPRLRLVASHLIRYDKDKPTNRNDKNALGRHLDRLRLTGDGHLDQVHAWRNRYKADVVVLLVRWGQGCGVGYLNASQKGAFSVVRQDCATGNYSFAHEIGHNLGAHHDPDTSTNRDYAYGHGFCNKRDNWRTVMSYDNGCYYRMPYFSNPGVSYSGMSTGDSKKRNNARVINERGPRVAIFR